MAKSRFPRVPKVSSAVIKSHVVSIAVKVIIGIIILVAFHILGLSVKNYFLRLDQSRKTGSVALIAMAQVSYITFLAIAVILILRVLGMEVASIVAIISAIAFVIGMSLQGTLSDIASGVVLALFQTYSIDDVIELRENDTKIVGRVVEFRFVNTILQDVYSGVRVTVPNRKVQESIIRNYSSLDMYIHITDILLSNTNKDFAMIIRIVKEELENKQAYPDIIDNPPIVVAVYDMSEVGTKLRVLTPITSVDVARKKLAIHTGIRNVLAKHDVVLVDPF
jgi:small conductance mechanosensitive channel